MNAPTGDDAVLAMVDFDDEPHTPPRLEDEEGKAPEGCLDRKGRRASVPALLQKLDVDALAGKTQPPPENMPKTIAQHVAEMNTNATDTGVNRAMSRVLRLASYLHRKEEDHANRSVGAKQRSKSKKQQREQARQEREQRRAARASHRAGPKPRGREPPKAKVAMPKAMREPPMVRKAAPMSLTERIPAFGDLDDDEDSDPAAVTSFRTVAEPLSDDSDAPPPPPPPPVIKESHKKLSVWRNRQAPPPPPIPPPPPRDEEPEPPKKSILESAPAVGKDAVYKPNHGWVRSKKDRMKKLKKQLNSHGSVRLKNSIDIDELVSDPKLTEVYFGNLEI